MAGQTSDVMLLAQATTTSPATAAPATTAAPAAATAPAMTAAPTMAAAPGKVEQAVKAAGTDANAAGAATTHATVGTAEAPIGFPPFDASTFASQILWLVLSFGVLYWVISRVAVPRIGGIVTKRKDKIDGDLGAADNFRKQTDKAIADYEAALATARGKAHSIAEETRAKAKGELDGKRAAVEADLAGKVSAAEASIQKAKTAALGNVDDIAADTAAALVTQLTGTVSADEAKAAVASVVKG